MDPITNSPIIKSQDDVYRMLDDLMQNWGAEWWDRFYGDRSKPIPFFRCIPDENLYSYVQKNIFRPGRVIDIGCGNGRNAIYLAQCGFTVDAIDFSKTSITWAEQNAKNEGVTVNFICGSIFEFSPPVIAYDYVNDSGCFHHINPHRRSQYLGIISGLLKPDGYFSMTCFNQDGSANISDYDVYRDGFMHGGMAYSEQKLRSILTDFFEIIEFRRMKDMKESELFGEGFLWTVLMKKR